MIVKHKVEDYNKWKSLFDAALPLRKMNGEQSCDIFRNSKDPNDVSILFEWNDIQKAIKYSQSEDLRDAMKHAGVIDQPSVYLLDGDLTQ